MLLVGAVLHRPRLGDLPSRNPRASRAWPRAGATAWRSRSSRSAAISARRWDRCSPPSSSCPTARAASPGSRSRRWSASSCSWQVGAWYSAHLQDRASAQAGRARASRRCRAARWSLALVVLALLTFTKNVYMAGLSSYYTFYVIEKFGVSVQESQVMLFLFLGASALGILLGGLFGDRFGAEDGDLVLDPRRAALHAGAALCRPASGPTCWSCSSA